MLTSMALIPTYVPFLFVFAAMIKLQREPAGPEVIRPPGGKPVAILLAVLGIITTTTAIILSVIPSDDKLNKPLAVMKVVGLALLLRLIGWGADGKHQRKFNERAPLPVRLLLREGRRQ